MFGFVTANRDTLSPNALARYRAHYCGLCRALDRQYGFAARLSLTYDMTFLVLLLGSMYEPEERSGTARCAPHPIKPHGWIETRYTAYAAALNVLLAYYNCEDDWQDEKNALKHGEALLLKKHLPAIRAAYPRQSAAVERQLTALCRTEAENGSADEAANLFAALMGELFVPDAYDRFADTLRRFGEALGRFIYLTDAAIDCEADRKRGRFNPLAPLYAQETARFDAHMKDLLTVIIGEAATAFETLPLVQDAELLRNILYSGVWTRWVLHETRQAQKERKRQ